LLTYNLKLKLFILITLDYFAELLTDFSYTNFTVGLRYADALDRLRVHLNIILFTKILSAFVTDTGNISKTKYYLIEIRNFVQNFFRR